MPRKAVSREQLIEVIKARVEAQLRLGDAHLPLPIPVQPTDGGTNWKIDVIVGVPSSVINDYMAIVRKLMKEYELKR